MVSGEAQRKIKGMLPENYSLFRIGTVFFHSRWWLTDFSPEVHPNFICCVFVCLFLVWAESCSFQRPRKELKKKSTAQNRDHGMMVTLPYLGICSSCGSPFWPLDKMLEIYWTYFIYWTRPTQSLHIGVSVISWFSKLAPPALLKIISSIFVCIYFSLFSFTSFFFGSG